VSNEDEALQGDEKGSGHWAIPVEGDERLLGPQAEGARGGSAARCESISAPAGRGCCGDESPIP